MFATGITGLILGAIILVAINKGMNRLDELLKIQAQATIELTRLVAKLDHEVALAFAKTNPKEYKNVKYINDPKAYERVLTGEEEDYDDY